MKLVRLRFWLPICLIALGSMAALPATARAQQTLIGMSSRSFNPGFSNGWIGVPLGLYAIDPPPEVMGTDGETQNLQLMLAGKITLSTGTQDAILLSAAEGRILPVITPCLYLRGILQRMAVLDGSPIHSFADFKGKRIGVPSLSFGGMGLLKDALIRSGVSPDDVQILAVGNGQQEAGALTTGRVDAAINADVDIAQLQTLGVKLRIIPLPASMQNAAEGYAYVFRKDWYEANKSEALEMVKGLVRSVIFMTANPEAAVRISYYMHPEAIPSGISRQQAIQNAIKLIKLRFPLIQKKSAVSDQWCAFPPAAWSSLAELIGLKGKLSDPAMFYTDEMIGAVNKINDAALIAWAKSLHVPENDADIPAWLKTLHPPLEDTP